MPPRILKRVAFARTLVVVLGIAYSVVTFAAPAGAVWFSDGTPVVIAPSGQYLHFYSQPIVPDGAGGFFTIWQDDRSGGNESDIYLQRIDGSGNSVWTVDGISVCAAAGIQQQPSLVLDGSGGVFVAWVDWRNDVGDVYLQHITSTGTVSPGWPTDGLSIATGPTYQTKFRIAADGVGGVYVVWENANLEGGTLVGEASVSLQHIQSDATIAPNWPAAGLFVINARATEAFPVMAPDGAGGAVVGWMDGRTGDSADRDIYAQRVATDGTFLWSAGGKPVCVAPGNQTPEALINGSDGFFLAWTDSRAYDIYAQRLTLAGDVAPGWGLAGVPVCTAQGSQAGPTLALDGAGGIYVTWTQDYRSPIASNGDVFVQRMDGDGSVATGWPMDGFPVCTVGGDQSYSKLVPGEDGSVFVTWQDLRTGLWDIYAQRILPTGAISPDWPTGGLVICSAAGSQQVPHPVLIDPTHAVVAWNDGRDLVGDIYAQRVALSDGGIGDQVPIVTAPATWSGVEGSPLQITVTASDPDGDAIQSLAAAGTAVDAGASFTLNESNTSGTLSWTPSCAKAGIYSVTFTAANALTSSVSTAITVDVAFQVTAVALDRNQYQPGDGGTISVTLQSQSFSGQVSLTPTVQLRGGDPADLTTEIVDLVAGSPQVATFDWTAPDVQGQAIVDLWATASGQGCTAQRSEYEAAVVNSLTPEQIQLAQQQVENCGVTSTELCSQAFTFDYLEAIQEVLPGTGTYLSLEAMRTDACLAAQYQNAGRHGQKISMMLVSAVEAVSAATSFGGPIECAVTLGLGCLEYLIRELTLGAALNLATGVVTCVNAYLDGGIAVTAAQGIPPRAAWVSADSAMGWFPDSLQDAFSASGHSLPNLVVVSGSAKLRVMADSSFATADSTGLVEATVLVLGSRPIQVAAIGSGTSRPFRVNGNPTDAVTLRLEVSTRDTCRVVLFHRMSDGTVTKLIYGPALLEDGAVATLQTSKDSTSFVFEVDQNRDGVPDWMLYPGSTVTGIPNEPSNEASRPSIRVLRMAPNPSSTSARMFVRISGKAFSAELHVFDVHGRVVAKQDLGVLTSGERVLTWDGLDASGQQVASGVYFTRVAYPGGASAPGRVILLR